MRLFRQRGIVIASIWLACQVTALAVSPFALSCPDMAGMTPETAVAAGAGHGNHGDHGVDQGLDHGTGHSPDPADDHDACCAGLAPGQMCPMHKHRAHGSSTRSSSSSTPASDREVEGQASDKASANASATASLPEAAPAAMAHHDHAQHQASVAPATPKTAGNRATPDESSDECAMRSGCDPLMPAIDSLFPSAALLTARSSFVVTLDAGAAVVPAAAATPSRSIAPDFRPPRA